MHKAYTVQQTPCLHEAVLTTNMAAGMKAKGEAAGMRMARLRLALLMDKDCCLDFTPSADHATPANKHVKLANKQFH